MAASNRAARLTKLVSVLKKHFKPTGIKERPLFESLLYSTLLENSTHEDADKAMAEIEKTYFDWNEVRVSTRTELAEHLKSLNDPNEAADRLKRTLQSVFESIYSFDMEAMKKQNLGQSVKQITAYDGVTPFAVAYVTQNGLSGHAIAVNPGVLLCLKVMDIITEAEEKKQQVPGLERAIPKNKGSEAGQLLHLMGVEIGRNPYTPAARKLLTDLDPTCKDRLPKRPTKKPDPPAKPKNKTPKPTPLADAKAAAEKKAPGGSASKKSATVKPAAAKKSESKPAAAKKQPVAKPTKKVVTKKATAKKPTTKKAAAKKTPVKKKAAKSAPKKATKKTAKKKVAKKTPAKKATAKKRKPR